MWRFLFSPDGRISRADIWLKYLLPLIGLCVVATIGNVMLIGEDAGPLWTALVLFYLWPSIAVHIKRFHDRGMTGWWVLVAALVALVTIALVVYGFVLLGPQLKVAGPITGPGALLIYSGGGVFVATELAAFVILYCLPGQKGANKYGEDPLAS
jgi:uncharacterized membrane protein YhaH (DUF805 family)